MDLRNGAAIRSSPALGRDGTLYVGSEDKKIYAIDGKTGAKKWEFLTGDKVLSSPALGTDGTLYCGSHDKKIYAIDGKTGAKKWNLKRAEKFTPRLQSAKVIWFSSDRPTVGFTP